MARTRDFESEIRKAQNELRAAGDDGRRSMADPETPGLQIRISAKTAVWVYRYRSGGVQRRLKLGTWTADGGMTVAKARKRAGTERLKVDAGIDPAIEKREAKLKAERAQRDSVETLVDAYIEKHAKVHKKSWRQDNLILRREVLPHWKQRPVSSLTRRDCRELLERIVARGGDTYAERCKAIIRRMLRYGVQTEVVDVNVATDLPRYAPPPEQEEPYSTSDLKKFWSNTETLAAPVRAAYRLALLTGCRFGEVQGMRWADVDGATGWWTLSGSATKNKRDHRVYLVPTALEELKRITRIEGDAYVLERFRADRVFTAANRLAYTGMAFRKHPNHALRRNVGTALGELGYPLEIIKATLNHAPGGGVTARYQRYSFDKEKQAAFLAWERRLLGIVTETAADSVVPFTKSRRNRAARPAGR